MVEKITIQPESIRGLGNIMNTHTVDDYEPYASSIIAGRDIINNIQYNVVRLHYTDPDAIFGFDSLNKALFVNTDTASLSFSDKALNLDSDEFSMGFDDKKLYVTDE